MRPVWLGYIGILGWYSIASAAPDGLSRDGILVQRDASNTTIPAPIVASVSQYWEGNDGPWSSFAIQVGQKAQNLRVLPSTASSFTFIVENAGCPNDAPSNCQESRGGIFNPNVSLTWVPNSIFQLGLSENLNVNIFGDFGFDSVTLGWQGSGGPTVEHSIVAGIGDTTFSWLGGLGLNPRPTNFSTFPNNPQISLLESLAKGKKIPSLSWAYTAGAPYRLDKVFGSLVLGGYDEARFSIPVSTSPTLTFPFYTDISKDIQVGISSISASSTLSSSSSTRLLTEGIYAFIDSTVPHLILPEKVCAAFESAFGLVWNSTAGFYFLNSTQHDALTKLNPSVTMTITPSLDDTDPKSRMDIVFPYSAFDLTASWPYAREPTRYFPLKRATNDTQYTLGRTFLQEAYLIADYERGNFSVWPCKWDSSIKSASIKPIRSINATTHSTNPGDSHSGKKSGLSSGAIAGVATGVAAIILLIVGTIFLILRHRRRHSASRSELSGDVELDNLPSYYAQKSGTGERSNLELDSRQRHEMEGPLNKSGVLEASSDPKAHEMSAGETGKELSHEDAKVVGELDGADQVFELDAAQVAEKRVPAIYLEPATAVSPAEGHGVDSLPSPVVVAARSGMRTERREEGNDPPPEYDHRIEARRDDGERGSQYSGDLAKR